MASDPHVNVTINGTDITKMIDSVNTNSNGMIIKGSGTTSGGLPWGGQIVPPLTSRSKGFLPGHLRPKPSPIEPYEIHVGGQYELIVRPGIKLRSNDPITRMEPAVDAIMLAMSRWMFRDALAKHLAKEKQRESDAPPPTTRIGRRRYEQ